MKKFKCVVTRVDEYEIEFDEDIINEEWMSDFRDFMYPFTELKEHAEHLAQYKARIDNGFIEGYGVVKINGRIPFPYNTEGHEGTCKEEGINIRVISEDRDIDIDVNQIG